MIWPAKITRAPTSSDFNRLLEQCKRLEVLETPDIKVQEQSSHGTKLRVADSGSSAATFYDFTFCRNGEAITISINAESDPALAEPN